MSKWAAATLGFALLATACGGGTTEITADAPIDQNERTSIEQVEPTAVPPAEPAPEPTATPEPETGSIQDVMAATVKISTTGTFVRPLEVAQSSFAGVGSGFIIDPSGLMVTNNHVVSGAAVIEVYFNDSIEPINARLLGVSECSDLAVLDLDGDGYEFLEFREDMAGVTPGLPIFAAGYPFLGDLDISTVDYTLTGGIVSTTQADGRTNFASVDGVIEHDARIRGGNSGGPLVDEQGRVVGINYSGNDTDDLNEAIDAAAARDTIEMLKTGDVESIGINAEALLFEDGSSGVWVSGVASGSPADRAGLLPGDLITAMENLPLATDGSMETYCDIIRTNGPQDTMSIEVVRFGTEEVLTGQINGTPLSQSFSFADELADEMTDSATTGATYTTYEFVADDTDNVGVEVPAEWIDRNGTLNTNFGESIYAAPDLDGFTDTWDVPGVIVERSTSLTSADIDTVLDVWADISCAERSGREPFQTSDEFFTGKWEVFTNCGGTETAVLTIAVSPPDGDSVVRMFFQIVTDADLDAADRAIASFDAVS